MLVQNRLESSYGPFRLELMESRKGYLVSLTGNDSAPQVEYFDLYPEAVTCFNILRDALHYIQHYESKIPSNDGSEPRGGVRCCVCHQLTNPERAHQLETSYIGQECWQGQQTGSSHG